MDENQVIIRRRAGRRSSFLKKHRVLMLFLLGLAACLFTFAFLRHFKEPAEPILISPSESSPSIQERLPLQPAKSERFIYPYSVIPGGVLSREELVRNMQKDRVVAEHYARFAAGQARIVKSEETQFVHVAYRLNNKVFWTAKKLRIPKGETLITDGHEFARTRCGNRVSAAPQEPVSDEEPAMASFDIPVLAKLEPATLETVPESGLELRDIPPFEPYIPVQPQSYPPIDSPKPYSHTYPPLLVYPPPAVVVPEPGTFSLLAIGLAALVAARIVRKK